MVNLVNELLRKLERGEGLFKKGYLQIFITYIHTYIYK